MSKLVPIDPFNPDPIRISKLAAAIRGGAVIAFPTDTAYGLAANPFDPAAVARLFHIKGRPATKPIILLIDGLKRLDDLVSKRSPLAEAVMAAYWPGPLTLVFEAAPALPGNITAGSRSIGIRFPKAALPVALVREAGFAITATSANRSGMPALVSAAEIVASIGGQIDAIIDGGPGCSNPSTLLDVRGAQPILLREGQISSGTLKRFFRARALVLR